MVNIKWDEDAGLKMNAIVSGVSAASQIVMSRETADTFYTFPVSRSPMLHSGTATGICAAASALAVNSSDRRYKRQLLAATGIGHLGCAVTHLWGWRSKNEKKQAALAGAGSALALAVLSFAAGGQKQVM